MDVKDNTERPESKKWNANFIINVCTVGIIMMTAGSCVAWPSPTIEKIRAGMTPIEDGHKDVTGIGYMFYLGSVLGVLMVWPCLAIAGHKPGLALSSFLYSTSWILLLCARSLVFVYGARFVAGLSQTMAMVLSPVYIVEISTVEQRQASGLSMLFFLNLGILLQYSVGPFVSYHILLILNLTVSLSFLISFPFISKQTPYFLMMKGKREEAEKVLCHFRTNKNKDIIINELQQIEKCICEKKSLKLFGQLKSLARTKAHLKSLVLIIGLTLLFVFSGLSQLIMFTESVFRLSGSQLSPSLSPIAVGALKLIAGLALPLFSTFFGIKTLSIASCIAGSFSMFFLALFFYLKEQHYDLSSFSWAPLVLLLVYFLFTTLGMGYLVQYTRAEVFPSKVKPTGIALQEIVNSVSLELCSIFFTQLILTPHIPFWFFSAVLLLGAPFIYFFLPDSRRMTLYDIESWFEKKT